MKIPLMLSIFLLSLNTFATKARVIALGTSFHLIDEQYGYTNPMNFHFLGNMVALESGLTTSTNTRNNAEGLISYGLESNGRVIVELGKNDDSAMAGRTLINSLVGAGTYMVPQNTVHLFYGSQVDSLVYYGGAYYSNKNEKVSGEKESSSGLVFSLKSGSTILFANYSLVNSVETATAQKFEGAGNLKLALRHKADDLIYGFDFINWTAKSETANVENESFGNQALFARIVKIQKSENGSELFYGTQLVSTTVDCKTHLSAGCSTKFSRLYLPVWIGIEANATDWLTLRGSITQAVELNNIKDEIGLPVTSGVAGATGAVSEFAPATNSTALALGAGIKFNRVVIDGTLASATSQNLNATNFLSQLGIIYRF